MRIMSVEQVPVPEVHSGYKIQCVALNLATPSSLSETGNHFILINVFLILLHVLMPFVCPISLGKGYHCAIIKDSKVVARTESSPEPNWDSLKFLVCQSSYTAYETR